MTPIYYQIIVAVPLIGAAPGSVSLCALRFLGFVPGGHRVIPEQALGFVSRHVDGEVHELLVYGARADVTGSWLSTISTGAATAPLPSVANSSAG